MAFIVEDGTIVANANSFVSVAFADSYFSDRGNAEWTALTDTEKQQALIKGTDYIEQVYAYGWKGVTASDEQALSFPRDGVYAGSKLIDYDLIPVRIKHAVCELSLQSLAGDLMPNIERQVKRKKVDVLETEFMDNAITEPYKAVIAKLVAPYLISASGIGFSSVALVR